MSNTLLKNFHLCFSKLKCLPPFLPSPPNSPPSPHRHHNTTITASTLIKNYNSIYDLTSQDYLPLSTATIDASDDDTSSSTPDLASLYASQRFFFSSPGRSNSIIDSSSFLSSSSSPETETTTEPLLGSSAGGVAIHKYSPDPYADFRRSMQEMLEARRFEDMESECEYLHELLLCYLTLNPKHTHKFIIGAFCDLAVGLMSPPAPENDRRRRARGRRHQRVITRRLLL